ncbi:hypothetical protein GH714_020664 [Hevea brasiliensis]|uniref:Major facilitator superfamily (MFS) profile domain-containing protein n=1 Tax=Hevea brasiliensis TaxID=3981 RepID=A0A6A6LZ83_HEVBR|nr:hypothetical protein GH714_020664 [Hevea brasiliensis]
MCCKPVSYLLLYQKTAWLAIFYMCIPTGYAVGYVYGGLVGGHFNWRWAFFGEAILMFPFVVLGYVMKPLQLKGFAPAESKKALTSVEKAVSEDQEMAAGNDGTLAIKEELNDKSSKQSSISRYASISLDQFSRFMKDMKALLVEKVYVVNVLGYIAYNFVIGAYSYWGPKAGYNIYNMLLSVATFLGAIFCFSAFCFKSMYVFLALFAIGELLVFATQGPVNYICLHCVKPSMRPLSMAISTVSIHLFGDVPSSPLVGVLQDYINNWRETALILTAILFIAAGIWFIGFNFRATHLVCSPTIPARTCRGGTDSTQIKPQHLAALVSTTQVSPQRRSEESSPCGAHEVDQPTWDQTHGVKVSLPCPFEVLRLV